MARNATIASFQVFSKAKLGSIGTAFDVDIVEALYQLLVQSTISDITANLSLGKSTYDNATTCAQASAFDIGWVVDGLLSRRIPVIAATGNTGNSWGLAWPSCIANVVKVSAVNSPGGTFATPVAYPGGGANIDLKSHQTGPILLAPGYYVTSSYPTWGGGPFFSDGGTSMAAPHVAGLYAVVKQASPLATVAEVSAWVVVNAVQLSVSYTDPGGNGIPPGVNESYPRIYVP